MIGPSSWPLVIGLIVISTANTAAAAGADAVSRYPIGHPYYQEPHIRINSISDLEPKHAQRAMKDVTQTISEVQKILATNPHLPRLTRGEIEELFENVTREEFEKSMRMGDRSRAKHMRALMVVLPYNTNNYTEDSLQELYNRPPITRVVSDAENKVVRPQQIVVPPEPGHHFDTDRNSRPVTTYKPQMNGNNAPGLAPTTFHPPKILTTIFTKLPVYSSPAKLLANTRPTVPAPATTAAASTQTYSMPTTPSTTAPTASTTTTTTTARPLLQSEKYNSPFAGYNNFQSPYGPQYQSVSSGPSVVRPNVKDLLATIGLTAEMPLTQRPPAVVPPIELTAEMRELLNSFGLLTNEQPPMQFNYDAAAAAAVAAGLGPFHDDGASLNAAQQEEFLPMAQSFGGDNSYNLNEHEGLTFTQDGHTGDVQITERPLSAQYSSFPSAGLSDEFLQPTSVTKHYRMHDAPEPSAGDYYAFKPLPLSSDGNFDYVPPVAAQPNQPLNGDMEAFLRSFGLLDGGNRNKKSIKSRADVAPSADQIAEPVTEITVETSTTHATIIASKPTPTKAQLQRMDRIPDVQVDFLSPQLLNVLGNIGVANHPAPLSINSAPAIPIKRPTTVRNSSPTRPAIVQPIASRRNDVIQPDDRTMYTVETTQGAQTMIVPTKITPKVTKMYPVFSSDMKPSTTSVPTPSTAKPNIMIVLPTKPTRTGEDDKTPRVTVVESFSSTVSSSQADNKPASQPSDLPTLDESASDYAKLQFLLATVKKLEQKDGMLSDADLEQLDLNKLNLSQTLMRYTQQAATSTVATRYPVGSLDPVRVVERAAALVAKNEVKRQSAEVTTTTTTEKSDEDSPFRFTLDLNASDEVTASNDTKTEGNNTTTTASSPKSTSSSMTATNSSASNDSVADSSEEKSLSSSDSPSSSTKTESSLLTKEVERPNSLEDSFPGGLDPVTEEPLPPPRRNGFYFFADWNSFLEVGEDPDKVIVRFDPKIGDPSRFIAVT